jgi:hypothetical protein
MSEISQRLRRLRACDGRVSRTWPIASVARLGKLLVRVFRPAIPSFLGGQGAIKVRLQHLLYGLDAVLWQLVDEGFKLVAGRHHAGIISEGLRSRSRLKPTRDLAITLGRAWLFVQPQGTGSSIDDPRGPHCAGHDAPFWERWKGAQPLGRSSCSRASTL